MAPRSRLLIQSFVEAAASPSGAPGCFSKCLRRAAVRCINLLKGQCINKKREGDEGGGALLGLVLARVCSCLRRSIHQQVSPQGDAVRLFLLLLPHQVQFSREATG